MNVKKGIKIDFTEQEEKAIQIMINIASTLGESCGGSCSKCPLNFFCGYNLNVNGFKKA